MATSRAVRSPSISSDVRSTRSGLSPAVPEARPPPAFVASTEASQLVSSEVDESVVVQEPALSLINSFLDHVLYNILSTAKSVQLGRLRHAVPVVLKPRLGKAALGAADEELKEYLNDGDDILTEANPPSDFAHSFDLDLAWKLARLRCMVYTRLGDMEEEDEEEYLESEQLQPGSGTYSNTVYRASSVHAASAIFLTSILEYLGEQALLYAVQNTQRRAHARRSPVALQLNETGPMAPPIRQSMVLDESDMFYVGRESPLSRLWRSWRRQTRGPAESISKHASLMQNDQTSVADKTPQMHENIASLLPHQIPLPISNNDVNEIEVPGLAREIVDDGDVQPQLPVPQRSKKRPTSMVIGSSAEAYQTSPESPQTLTVKQRRRSRPMLGHRRSMSHPTPEKQTFSTISNSAPQDTNIHDDQPETEKRRSQQPTSDLTTDTVPSAVREMPVRQEESEPGHSTAGTVATAISAAAGAVGLGGLASTIKPKNEVSTEPQSTPVRTVADKMIGMTPQVAPPTDALTGSSITNADDFDNLHIPIEKLTMLEKAEPSSRLDSSDPEDLALSSGDEDASERKPGMVASTSRPLSNDESDQQSAVLQESNTTASEVVPPEDTGRIVKATNLQEKDVPTAQELLEREAPIANHEESHKPQRAPIDHSMLSGAGSDYQNVITPATSSFASTDSAVTKNLLSSAYAQPEKSIARESIPSQPSTATATVQSSIPPRVSSDRSGSRHGHTDSRTSQYSQESQRSSSSSKLLGFTRDHEGRPQTGTFHAAVTDGPQSYTHVSSDNGREVVSENSSRIRQPLDIETNTAIGRDIDQAEAKKKSLEILIHGDETLHYTLTPISARAENFPLPGHSPDTSLNLSSRDTSSAVHHSTASNNSATTGGLRASPVKELASSPSTARYVAYDTPAGGVASSSPSTPAKSRGNRAQPRDARLDNTTMMDLADYARSTGPENEQQLPKALSSRPGTGTTAKSVQSSASTVRALPPPPVPPVLPNTQQSQGSKSVGARARFQAREPTVPRRSGTNDLIEFLKEGPPPSAEGSNGHISNGNSRASAASTMNSSVAPRSVQESTKSSTALLASNRAQPKRANGTRSGSSAAAQQRDTMPARKQRRVRDPYAIDDSDDDLEEQQTPSQVKRTQDESLIDFLRNTAPPPGSSPPPILEGSVTGPSNGAAAGAMKRQGSNHGIRDRIMRSASRSSLNRKAGVNRPPPTDRYDKPARDYISASHARAASPHLTQIGKKMDSYKPTRATEASPVDRSRGRRGLVARPPTSEGRTGTAELAEYLKSTGPPGVQGGSMRQSSIVKEEAGFLKFFSRRKAMK